MNNEIRTLKGNDTQKLTITKQVIIKEDIKVKVIDSNRGEILNGEFKGFIVVYKWT
jgi:hypothetical protein